MCDCIQKMDEALAEHNSRVVTSCIHNSRTDTLTTRVKLTTEKLNTRNRSKMGAIATFCPFCGERYVADAALAACGEG